FVASIHSSKSPSGISSRKSSRLTSNPSRATRSTSCASNRNSKSTSTIVGATFTIPTGTRKNTGNELHQRSHRRTPQFIRPSQQEAHPSAPFEDVRSGRPQCRLHQSRGELPLGRQWQPLPGPLV